MTDGPSVAISIVNYRVPDALVACLRALESERRTIECSVTVVDNAPDESFLQRLSADFPWVRVIANRSNVGFARAHNQALRGSPADFFLLLNPDAVVQPGAVATLVRVLSDHPRAAIAGPCVVYPDGRPQPSRRRFPTPATFFVESTQLQRFFPRQPLIRRFYVQDQPDDALQEVDWVVGACLCVRAVAASQIGLLDERYFLYSEELDWCRRFRAAGWSALYVPAARVTHAEGASSRQDVVARDVLFHRSRLLYARLWFGPGVARALRAYLTLEYALRSVEETGKAWLGSRPAERIARVRHLRAVLPQLWRG